MKRAWRLQKQVDVQRVWQEGRAFAHPLVILRVRANQLPQTRAAVVAGKKLGNAVERNRAKRRLREALRAQFLQIAPGFDLVLIARGNVNEVPFTQIVSAVHEVLVRANLLSV